MTRVPCSERRPASCACTVPRGEGVRKGKGSRRLRKVSDAKWSIRTAYHRKSGSLARPEWNSRLAGYTGGANEFLDIQNLISNGEKTVMAFLSGMTFLSGMKCRRHDTIVSTAGHYKVSEGS